MFRVIPTGLHLARALRTKPLVLLLLRPQLISWFPRNALTTSILRLEELRKPHQSTPQLEKKQPKHSAPSVAASETKKVDSSISSDVYTIPNILTMTRIVATPGIGYFIAIGQSTAAISLFLYSCVTDAVDGYIARHYNMKSVLGSILDPAADKFLMTVCTAALGLKGIMPWYVATIIIGRDVMLSFMAFYFRYKSLPVPKTLARFFDMSIVTHTVHPNLLGKVNTALQMVYIGGLVLLPGLNYMMGSEVLTEAFDWFGVLVAATTFASGASYIFSKNAMKVLR
ncbi:CIC11C00000002036 [Sungouiella intermedia]|uniref:CIC11C00000002036 n=1 Tax=Sungouiella intermedia TaxID=45354 RepID=A0A1L0DXG3_9ASCO|nr:CIC11C00000002036 [[Candida] intermedia]